MSGARGTLHRAGHVSAQDTSARRTLHRAGRAAGMRGLRESELMLLMVLDTGAADVVEVDSCIRHSIQLDLEVTSGACSPLNSACIPLWGMQHMQRGV